MVLHRPVELAALIGQVPGVGSGREDWPERRPAANATSKNHLSGKRWSGVLFKKCPSGEPDFAARFRTGFALPGVSRDCTRTLASQS
jgi:hypothetical protein